MKNKNRLFYKIGLILLTIIIVIFLSFYIYSLDYYKALPEATIELNQDNIEELSNGKLIVIKPQDEANKIGIIFYPGGKVDYKAYVPLLEKISNNGYTSYLVKMPFNLAVFNKDAAKNIIEKYGKIEKWYIVGHSLGGSMASIYANENSDKIGGLILLASYPAVDLTDSNIPMLSIYGSRDGVLNMVEVEKAKESGPKDASYLIIEGGNHSYFGNYGEQEGDGQPTITLEEQQKITIDTILSFLQNH